MKTFESYAFIVVLLVSISSCAVSEKKMYTTNADKVTGSSKSVKGEVGSFNSLSDYLKRVPGVQMVNGVFQIRGTQSANDTEPLYVINGVPVANSFDRANSMVDANDIAKVNVLKDVGQTSKYGMRGSTGVIEIFTKSGEDQ